MKLQLVGGPFCGKEHPQSKDKIIKLPNRVNSKWETIEMYELNYNKYTQENTYLYCGTQLVAVANDE